MPLGYLLPPWCHPHPENATTILLVDWHGSLHEMVGSPLTQLPGAQNFPPNSSLTHPPYSPAQQLCHFCQRLLLWAPVDLGTRQLLYPPLHGPLQSPRGHVRCHSGRINRTAPRISWRTATFLSGDVHPPSCPITDLNFAPSWQLPYINYSASANSQPAPTTLAVTVASNV